MKNYYVVVYYTDAVSRVEINAESKESAYDLVIGMNKKGIVKDYMVQEIQEIEEKGGN